MNLPSLRPQRAGRRAALFVALLALTTASTLRAQEDDLELLEDDTEAEAEIDPSIWVLDCEVKQLRMLTVLDGPDRGEVFWYLIYSIRNRGEEDRSAFISVSGVSDGKKTYTDILHPVAERAIERKYGQPLRGKTDLRLLQEERNIEDVDYNHTTFEAGQKVDCVAILNKFDAGANKIRIIVRGLSNDLKMVEGPGGETAIEERVFAIEAERPQDRYKIGLDQFKITLKSWQKLRTPLARPTSETEPEE